MTVYMIEVDGTVDHACDVDDPEPWVAAVCLLEGALAGGRPVKVEAVRAPRETVDCNPLIWFGARTALDDV